MIFQAVIEIPFGTNIKYEYDENHNLLRCDRILNTSMSYPGNYGYIPNTLGRDNDPLDAVVLCDSLIPGSTIKCKLIGALETTGIKPFLFFPKLSARSCWHQNKKSFNSGT